MQKPLIVITGASSGIGRAVAQEFSRNDYPLLLLARRLDCLDSLNLPNTICRSVDITDYSAIAASLSFAEGQYGTAECLINNAGVMFANSFHEQTPGEWEQMIETNLKGAINCTHLVMNSMLKNNKGTVINVSSIAGKKGFPMLAAYCATKYAISGFTESLRIEAAKKNLRFISVSPGYTETELYDHTTNPILREDYKQWGRAINNILFPEDVARAIFFAFQQPQHVCIRELIIAPTEQTD